MTLLPIVWGCLLLTPNLVYFAVAAAPYDALIRTLPPSLVLLVALTCWTRHPGFVLILLLPFYLLLPYELFYIIQYENPSSSHILAVVSESNHVEAVEYIGAVTIAWGIAISLILGVLTVLVARYSPRIPSHRLTRMLAFASLIPLLQYTYLEWDWEQTKHVFDAEAAQTSLESLMTTEIPTPTSVTLSDSYPLGVYFRVRDYIRERTQIQQAAAIIQKYNFHARRLKTPSGKEVYVLVIGESARPDHFGINGYTRDTTPELSKISNLVSFRNAVSPWAATRLAVPVMIVGQSEESLRAPLDHASIIALFKQAGFKTYWISNQAPLGLHDSIITVHAYEADEVVYTNATTMEHKGTFDDALIPVFSRFLDEPVEKQFFIIHMMGSHLAYANRYPERFDRFRPSLQSNPKQDNSETIGNSYDNSILFTDHVLARIIRSLQADNTIESAVFYSSDHGQNLPTESCSTAGHGHRTEYDYRIASLLWLSDAYTQANPDALMNARKRIEAPLYSAGVIHTLADLAQIRYSDFKPHESWVSNTWVPAPRRTNIVPNFDTALKEGPCRKLKMPPST